MGIITIIDLKIQTIKILKRGYFFFKKFRYEDCVRTSAYLFLIVKCSLICKFDYSFSFTHIKYEYRIELK